jgi:hypothetical protein
MTSPMLPRCTPSSIASWTPWPGSCRRSPPLDAARADILAFTTSSKTTWWQTWSNNPRNGPTGNFAAAPMPPGSFPAATP